MIAAHSLEQLKARADIVDVVGHFVELKKAGANFKACCPFHGENTPSFVVSPQKQMFKCFGCGIGGDAIKFVQEYKKLDFPEAVEDIAALMNFRLEYARGHESRGVKQEILEKMAQFFQVSLAKEHIAYLKDRGVSRESVSRFGIGWAPDTKAQIQFLTQNRFSLVDAQEVGVLAEENGRRYARFTKRITFAIRNANGKIVGFSGRILPGDHRGAKYLNTPSTPLFDKGRILYGFDTAKEAIYQKRVLLLLEGQLDALLCQQEGIGTACATLGTSLGAGHLPQIKRSGAKVLLAYDGDRAGYEAAVRAARLLAEYDIAGGVALLPEGADPADLLREGRKAELVAILKRHTDSVKFVLHDIATRHDLAQPYEKSQAVKEAGAFLLSIGDPVIADSYRGYAAQLFGVGTHYFGKSAPKEIAQSMGGDIGELAIIKSIAANDRLGDVAVEILDEEAMQMRTEYMGVLRGDSESISAITIRDDVPVYDSETFVKAVKLKQKQFLWAQQKRLAEAKAPVAQLLEINRRLKELS